MDQPIQYEDYGNWMDYEENDQRSFLGGFAGGLAGGLLGDYLYGSYGYPGYWYGYPGYGRRPFGYGYPGWYGGWHGGYGRWPYPRRRPFGRW